MNVRGKRADVDEIARNSAVLIDGFAWLSNVVSSIGEMIRFFASLNAPY